MGSHWTVTDDEPLLVAEDFGGGSRIWARTKSMEAMFQPFFKKAPVSHWRNIFSLIKPSLPHRLFKLSHSSVIQLN